MMAAMKQEPQPELSSCWQQLQAVKPQPRGDLIGKNGCKTLCEQLRTRLQNQPVPQQSSDSQLLALERFVAMPNNAVKRFCGREHLRQIWDWLARTIEDASHPEPGVVTLFTEHYEKFYELL